MARMNMIQAINSGARRQDGPRPGRISVWRRCWLFRRRVPLHGGACKKNTACTDVLTPPSQKAALSARQWAWPPLACARLSRFSSQIISIRHMIKYVQKPRACVTALLASSPRLWDYSHARRRRHSRRANATRKAPKLCSPISLASKPLSRPTPMTPKAC